MGRRSLAPCRDHEVHLQRRGFAGTSFVHRHKTDLGIGTTSPPCLEGQVERTLICSSASLTLTQSGHLSSRDASSICPNQLLSTSLALVKLTAAQEPLCDVSGLQDRAFGWRMGRKVARNRN